MGKKNMETITNKYGRSFIGNLCTKYSSSIYRNGIIF